VGTRIHKFFLNSGGFTLPEVLIGGAILAGVALGSATLFQNQKKAQRSVEYDQKLAIYHSQLSRTMGTASNCNATLKSIYATPPTSIAAGNITTLFHCVPSASNKCVDDNTSTGQSFDAYTASA
jgi:type II secretory pathway pseudopilin PulG